MYAIVPQTPVVFNNLLFMINTSYYSNWVGAMFQAVSGLRDPSQVSRDRRSRLSQFVFPEVDSILIRQLGRVIIGLLGSHLGGAARLQN